jgi:hypothetical protein
MPSRRVRRIAGLFLLLISLALLCWGIWPLADRTQILNIPPENLQLPTPQSYIPQNSWLCTPAVFEPVSWHTVAHLKQDEPL